MAKDKNINKSKSENTKSLVDLSRRRLAKVAILGAPVIASSKSASANVLFNKNNCTVSGNLSGNMSDNVNNSDPCNVYQGVGRSPGFYKQEDGTGNRWPLVYNGINFYYKSFCLSNDVRDYNMSESDCSALGSSSSWVVATKFFDVFSVSMLTSDSGGGTREATIYEVLWDNTISDPHNLAFHAVAAYFNAVHALLGNSVGISNYFYTPEEVVNLYQTYYDKLTPGLNGISEAEALALAFSYMES